jgi:hypothetical protein
VSLIDNERHGRKFAIAGFSVMDATSRSGYSEMKAGVVSDIPAQEAGGEAACFRFPAGRPALPGMSAPPVHSALPAVGH